jgi:hypothetical protein
LAGDAQRTRAVGAADDEPAVTTDGKTRTPRDLATSSRDGGSEAYSCASAASTAASMFCRFWAGVSSGGFDVVEQPVIEPIARAVAEIRARSLVFICGSF